RVLAPLAVRARVVEAMRLHIEAHAIEFDTYVSAVQVQLAAASTDLDNQPGVREPVRQNVATPPRVDKLYARMTGEVPMRQHAARLLQFDPARSSYRNCANLGDHYTTGPSSLIERIEDYSASRA